MSAKCYLIALIYSQGDGDLQSAICICILVGELDLLKIAMIFR